MKRSPAALIELGTELLFLPEAPAYAVAYSMS